MARRSKRRCSRGMRKGSRVCKRKPGPKKSRRSKRRCSRGVKRTSPRKGSCRRKPGPKRSRSSSRSSTKVKPNYQKYLYYVKGKDLMQAPRAGHSGSKKVVKKNSVKKREPGYLYYAKPVGGYLEVRKRKMKNH